MKYPTFGLMGALIAASVIGTAGMAVSAEAASEPKRPPMRSRPRLMEPTLPKRRKTSLDFARLEAAQIKRDRKNAKRLRDHFRAS